MTMKRTTAILLAAAVTAAAVLPLSGCVADEVEAKGLCNVKAGVMGGGNDSEICRSELENGILANIDVSVIGDDDSLGDYDIIYVQEVRDADRLTEYVRDGGTVVLSNDVVDNFDGDFLGGDVAEVTGIPTDLAYPYTGDNLSNISELIYDYTQTIKSYTDYEAYVGFDYGVGIVPTTADVIAERDGVGVYTRNAYGEGDVFITNPILPSEYTVTQLSEGVDGEPMAFSTNGAESLLRSYYAEYVSKKKYGFAVERTFGTFGTKSAAWELHYEDITGIENGSLTDFAKYCMEKGQMPSFTLVRNTYTWFKRAESVTYLEYDNGFHADAYEGAYCSGTHIVSGDKWLELDCYEKTDSYFDDKPEYVKRAYPYPIDWNEDGKWDLIVGSADGKFYYYEGRNMGTNYEMSTAAYLTDEQGNALSVGAYSSPTVFDIDGDGRGELISGAEDGIIRAFKTNKTAENPSSMAFTHMGDVINTDLTDCMVASGYLNDDNIIDLAVGSRGGELRVYFGYTTDGVNTLFDDYVPVVTGEEWTAPEIYEGKLFCGTREGYVAHFDYDGSAFVKSGYLETDTNSRRGNKRITIGMNSVPRFCDIDGDGDDDLLAGNLEYGMAYPIDSEYFPYEDELREQLAFCEENGIYVGAHGMTHKYASPTQERRELDYHKAAFEIYGLAWDSKGINQHTWFTSMYGYDGSGIEGYNPNYNGTFKAQAESGLLWNSGSTLPESSAVPQDCAENTIPMPMYMAAEDFVVLQPCNTPHGDGTHSYTTVKYELPLLFYNHCDYMYDDLNSQVEAAEKVAKITDEYGYAFVREDQMAKAVSAAYNTDIKADMTDGVIKISGLIRDENRRLYDERYTECVGVKVVFADGEDAADYSSDASVCRVSDNAMYVSLDKAVNITKGEKSDKLSIAEVNVPARIKLKNDGATVKFVDGGMMSVKVLGDVMTSSDGWNVKRDGEYTVFTKFGAADTLKIKK